ncbi:hypothetical protein NQZ79_g343 [Umbelopsis isabellina]|nr:hypothetical protein NQZ79_g343 [Umbelopsis isabellina]
MRLRQEFQQSCDDLLQRFNETEQRKQNKAPTWPPRYDQIENGDTKPIEYNAGFHDVTIQPCWPESPKESSSSSSSSSTPSIDTSAGFQLKTLNAPITKDALTICNTTSCTQSKTDHEPVSLTILSIPDICKQ